MEIIGWDKSKKMVYIGECNCGAIIQAKRSEVESRWNYGSEQFEYESKCPDCAGTVPFKEMTEAEWEESK